MAQPLMMAVPKNHETGKMKKGLGHFKEPTRYLTRFFFKSPTQGQAGVGEGGGWETMGCAYFFGAQLGVGALMMQLPLFPTANKMFFFSVT